MSEYRYATCDVFTDTPFSGNPLAVVTDARGLSDAQMQSIAREFNFSETTFVFPPDDARHAARIRIFTPGGELPFAGHPTVGTAFVLATLGLVDAAADSIVLEERVGPVPVAIERLQAPMRVGRCTLSAAQLPQRVATGPAREPMAAVLGLKAADIAGVSEAWSCGVPFLVVPLASVEALERCRLDHAKWHDELSAFVTQKVYPVVQVDDATWRVRMFAPGAGIAEDPATGGAAAAVAGWLAGRRKSRDSRSRWTLLQGLEMGRPSRLEVEADFSDAGEVSAVRVGGHSVLVSTGELRI